MSKLGFKVLVELLINSIQSPASSQSVRAVSVRFARVRNCITFGIALFDYTFILYQHMKVT